MFTMHPVGCVWLLVALLLDLTSHNTFAAGMPAGTISYHITVAPAGLNSLDNTYTEKTQKMHPSPPSIWSESRIFRTSLILQIGRNNFCVEFLKMDIFVVEEIQQEMRFEVGWVAKNFGHEWWKINFEWRIFDFWLCQQRLNPIWPDGIPELSGIRRRKRLKYFICRWTFQKLVWW